jgi:hypothetical protein
LNLSDDSTFFFIFIPLKLNTNQTQDNDMDVKNLTIVSIISLTLILFTTLFVLKTSPFSGDDQSYLFQAKIFAKGKLYANVPEKPEFFSLQHTEMNNGKWYSIFPITWSLILSLGMHVNLQWIINPVLGLFTLFIIFLFTKLVYDIKTAHLALIFAAFSPFYIFNSASYYSHVPALFFASLSILLFQKSVKSGVNIFLFFSGISAGLMILIRPIDGLIMGLPLICYAIYLTRKKNFNLKQFLLFLIPTAFVLSFLFYTNFLYSNNPFIFPNLSYITKNNIPNFGLNLVLGFKNLIYRLQLLFFWFPVIFIFAPFSFLSKNQWNNFLASVVFFNIFVYFLVLQTGGDQFGPRYYFISFTSLVILSANGFRVLMMKFRNLRYFLILIIGLDIFLFGFYSYDIAREVNFRNQVYQYVKENEITNALIFMKSSNEEGCSFYTRNPPFLDSDVLYVCDLGNRNKELMTLYPERNYHFFDLKNMGKSPSYYRENLIYGFFG